MDFERLELSTETLRDLGDEELTKVVGGQTIVTQICPSGATWFKDCDTYVTCH